MPSTSAASFVSSAIGCSQSLDRREDLDGLDWTGLATLVVGIGRGCSFCCFLLLAGRREDRRRKREVLEETMVSLFDASFGYVDRAALNAAKVGKSSASTKSALRCQRQPKTDCECGSTGFAAGRPRLVPVART